VRRCGPCSSAMQMCKALTPPAPGDGRGGKLVRAPPPTISVARSRIALEASGPKRSVAPRTTVQATPCKPCTVSPIGLTAWRPGGGSSTRPSCKLQSPTARRAGVAVREPQLRQRQDAPCRRHGVQQVMCNNCRLLGSIDPFLWASHCYMVCKHAPLPAQGPKAKRGCRLILTHTLLG